MTNNDSTSMYTINGGDIALDHNIIIHLVLFHNIKNSDKLWKHIFSNDVASTSDSASIESSYVFLNPHMLVSVRHIIHAVCRALNKEKRGCMKSRNLNSEIFFCLGGSPQITDCMKVFGINKKSSEVLILMITSDTNISSTNKLNEICNLIEGDRIPLETCIGHDFYLNKDTLVKSMNISYEELSLPGGLEAAILNRICIKDI